MGQGSAVLRSEFSGGPEAARHPPKPAAACPLAILPGNRLEFRSGVADGGGGLRSAYEALPAIYDISIGESAWGPTLDTIVGLVEGRGAALFGVNETDFDYSVSHASAFWQDKAAFIDEFMTRFGHYDRHGRGVLLRQPHAQPITDHDIWPNEALFDREDIRYMRENLGIFLRCGVNMSPAHGWKAGLIVHFPEHMSTVRPAARETLALLGPHLKKSLELRRFVSQLVARYRLVMSVLDKVRVGICVADPNGEMVIVNNEARAILDKGAGLRLDRGNRIVARDPDVTARIGAALGDVIRTAHTISGDADVCLHVQRTDGGAPFYLELSPLREAGTEFEQAFAGAFVTIIDPDNPPEISPLSLVALCGLTGAEREVAGLLLRGLPIDTIAEMRNVSPETIKTQTRAIYQKARVGGRGELIRKAAHLSPPIL